GAGADDHDVGGRGAHVRGPARLGRDPPTLPRCHAAGQAKSAAEGVVGGARAQWLTVPGGLLWPIFASRARMGRRTTIASKAAIQSAAIIRAKVGAQLPVWVRRREQRTTSKEAAPLAV